MEGKTHPCKKVYNGFSHSIVRGQPAYDSFVAEIIWHDFYNQFVLKTGKRHGLVPIDNCPFCGMRLTAPADPKPQPA